MTEQGYNHSVTLDLNKCKGCTNCLKRCPTEAIRIRNGHAVIRSERCIDCGECIRLCPYQAKKAVCDSLADFKDYKWKIALPAPALYGQFDNLEDLDYIVSGLRECGFDDVFEVARAAELVSAYTREYLHREDIPKPVISSACPVVVRLISVRFPYLLDNVLPILPPVEIAARMAKREALEKHPELREEDICALFISPCPAKVSYQRNPLGTQKSALDGVLGVNEIYFKLVGAMNGIKEPQYASETGIIGLSWAGTGGESAALLNDKYLAADGIENVIKVLDEIEKAHPEVFNLFLQILDDGRVADSHGKIVNFENTIIIMTTNAGSEFKSAAAGFNSNDEVKLDDNVDKSLKQFFKPEFLNRIDEIVTFKPLTKENLRQIIDLLLKDIHAKLAEKDAKLVVTDEAKELILEKGYDKRYGARPLKRAIQKLLEDKLSILSLTGQITSGCVITADRKDNEITLTAVSNLLEN